ncbi:MAG: DUF58 domain-containing protein [Pirellulales bacterium]|nr:DUF58 domain-containing protein [Pirellulales bacterium]
MQSLLNRYLDPAVLAQVADRHFEPRQLVLGNLAGAHKSPLAGFAVEFAGHREYAPGDDPKHIDWRVYFTRDKYFIKQYEMETNFVAHLLLDVSASMRYGADEQQKLAYAAKMLVSLGYSIVKQSDKVALATFDTQIRGVIPPSNSMSQILRMTEHLDKIQPVEKTSLTECLSELTGRMGRRQIIMIFSDFLTDLSGLESALQQMRYNKHEVILFQTLHHDELEFDFEGMVKFVGLEITEEILTQPDELRRGYLQALRKFQDNLAEICYRNRVEHVVVDTSRPMAEVLADYLNQRSLLAMSR